MVESKSQGLPIEMQITERGKSECPPVMGRDRDCNIIPRESVAHFHEVFLYKIVCRIFERGKANEQ
jgi:hypothetical protein